MNDTWITYKKPITVTLDKSIQYDYVENSWQKSKNDTVTNDTIYIATRTEQKNQHI